MSLVCLLTFHHRYKPLGPSCGFERWQCERCGRIRARVLPSLYEQVPQHWDRQGNPKYWVPGPGVSATDQVGVGNRWLQRGYANEELAPPPTTGNRSN